MKVIAAADDELSMFSVDVGENGLLLLSALKPPVFAPGVLFRNGFWKKFAVIVLLDDISEVGLTGPC